MLAYLENCYGRPQYVVKVFAITFTERMLAYNLRTSAFPFLSSMVHKFTKLTPK